MAMPIFKKRIIFIFFTILYTLILAEIFLRLIGFLFVNCYITNYRTINKTECHLEKSKKILCLGDSFTFGIGASRKGDYPTQLSNILNNDQEGNNFIVYNLGVGGQNSSELLYLLNKNVDKYNPDLVIVMTGGNDGHNTRLHKWAMGKNDRLAVFQNLRIYKLLYYLICHFTDALQNSSGCDPIVYIAQNNEEGQKKVVIKKNELEFLEEIINYIENGQSEIAQQQLLNKVTQENIWQILAVLKQYNAYTIEERLIKHVLQVYGYDEWLYFTLGRILMIQGKNNKGEAVFINILRKNPENNYIRLDLSNYYINSSRYKEAKALLFEQVKYHGGGRRVYELLLKIYEHEDVDRNLNKILHSLKEYTDITEQNILTIEKELLKRGIRLIVLGYPRKGFLFNHRLDNVVYLDLSKIFNKIDIAHRHKLFAADNSHCSDEGNRIIAENLAIHVRNAFDIK